MRYRVKLIHDGGRDGWGQGSMRFREHHLYPGGPIEGHTMEFMHMELEGFIEGDLKITSSDKEVMGYKAELKTNAGSIPLEVVKCEVKWI